MTEGIDISKLLDKYGDNPNNDKLYEQILQQFQSLTSELLHIKCQHSDMAEMYRKEAEKTKALTSERDKLREAVEANMEWIGPPPTDPHSFDSLREDAWKLGQKALNSEPKQGEAEGLMDWAEDHYWDSLENDKNLVLLHLKAYLTAKGCKGQNPKQGEDSK